MNPLSIILGFVPQVVFALLVNWVPLGWAAGGGLAVALVLIALTAARGGVKILPLVQGVILGVFTLIGFSAAPETAAMVAPYARAAASLILGTFIVVTSFFFPFTVQFARADVPRQYWHTARFLDLNRRISLAWGIAVLAVSASQIVSARVGQAGTLLGVLLQWGVPAIAAYLAYSVTTRAIAASARSRPAGHDQPATPAAS